VKKEVAENKTVFLSAADQARLTPPDALPRADVTCRLPDGRSVALGEPDGRPGVLPIDVRVRSLRLLLNAGNR
jgi:hypothetical protein